MVLFGVAGRDLGAALSGRVALTPKLLELRGLCKACVWPANVFCQFGAGLVEFSDEDDGGEPAPCQALRRDCLPLSGDGGFDDAGERGVGARL